jgi:hypothetical protein
VIRLSSRHARGLIGVLLFFSVPLLLTELRARRRDDCRDPALLFVTSAIEGSKPTGESMPSASKDVIQWSYGQLANPQFPKNPLRFQVVRSYDRAYLSPTQVLGTPLDPEVHSLERVPANGTEVPIHMVIDNTRDPSRFAAWVFAHDGRPVENPLFAMLSSAPRQLALGSQPVTVLMVDGILLGEDPAPILGVAKRWLVAAWEYFAQACL